MALSGAHFACCFIGGPGVGQDTLPIPSEPIWSENPSSGTATTNVVMGSDPVFKGRPMIRVTVSADSYVAFGKVPNASASPRAFCRALVEYDFFVKEGDRAAWVAA